MAEDRAVFEIQLKGDAAAQMPQGGQREPSFAPPPSIEALSAAFSGALRGILHAGVIPGTGMSFATAALPLTGPQTKPGELPKVKLDFDKMSAMPVYPAQAYINAAASHQIFPELYAHARYRSEFMAPEEARGYKYDRITAAKGGNTDKMISSQEALTKAIDAWLQEMKAAKWEKVTGAISRVLTYGAGMQLGAAAGGSEAGWRGAGDALYGAISAFKDVHPAVRAFTAVIDFASGSLRGFAEQQARNIRFAATVAREFILNDMVGAGISKLEKQIAELGSGPFGTLKIVGLQLPQLLAGLKGFQEISAAINQRMAQVAPFSMEASMGMAQARMIEVQAKLREAEKLGPLYGSFARDQAMFQAAMSAALEPLKRTQIQNLDALLSSGKSLYDMAEAMKNIKSDTELLQTLDRDSEEYKAIFKEFKRLLEEMKRRFDPDYGRKVLDALREGGRLLPAAVEKEAPPEWVRQQQIKPLG